VRRVERFSPEERGRGSALNERQQRRSKGIRVKARAPLCLRPSERKRREMWLSVGVELWRCGQWGGWVSEGAGEKGCRSVRRGSLRDGIERESFVSENKKGETEFRQRGGEREREKERCEWFDGH
jgi:hypothetical protein